MRKGLLLVGVLVAVWGCAIARRETGPAVDVYEADAAAPATFRRLPEGCRLLGASGPVDEMESERMMDDPYRRRRREVAEKGGNVLLVLSQRTVTRPNSDCPSGDISPDCLRGAQTWYRVSFEEFACAPQAVAELKRLPPARHTGGITIPLWRPKKATAPETETVDPGELKSQVLNMMKEGVSTEVILAYVKGQRLSRKMTAPEIIEWTRAGIPDAVVEAAAAR